MRNVKLSDADKVHSQFTYNVVVEHLNSLEQTIPHFEVLVGNNVEIQNTPSHENNLLDTPRTGTKNYTMECAN